MYSLIFFLRDGKGLTSNPHGLHFDIWVVWSFLKVCMLLIVQTVISKSIMSSDKLQEKWLKRKLQCSSGHKLFSRRISVMSYTVSIGLLEAKMNQAKPCFNIIWKSKGSSLTMHLILNLSQNFYVTNCAKSILLPYKVMLTSFQSNSNIPQVKFHFKFTFSGANIPVILNKWKLPAILQSLMIHNIENLI